MRALFDTKSERVRNAHKQQVDGLKKAAADAAEKIHALEDALAALADEARALDEQASEEENEDGHAGTLMAGSRSDDGRGADIVVRDMRDLVPVVDHFKSAVESGEKAPVKFPRALLDGLVDKYWVDEARVVA